MLLNEQDLLDNETIDINPKNILVINNKPELINRKLDILDQYFKSKFYFFHFQNNTQLVGALNFKNNWGTQGNFKI